MSTDLDATPAPDAEPPSFWLFQFREDESRNWRRRIRLGQTQDWVASRFRKDMQEGDVVFLWMTTDEGGLHGWGTLIRKDDQTKSASIIIGGWIDSPISRARVLDEKSFDPGNLFVRVSQGTNFRLSLEEARALSRYFPDSSDLIRRIIEPRRVPSARLPQSIEPGAFTPEAFDLIHRAASFIVGPSGAGQVTSTRLLLALGSRPQVSPTDDGHVGEAFLAATATNTHIASAMKALEADYRREGSFTDVKPSRITFSANSMQIVTAAREITEKVYGKKEKIGADAIAAGLFAGNGRVQGRIGKHIVLDQLLSGISANFSAPADAVRFELALKLAKGATRSTFPGAEQDRELIFASLGNDDPWSGVLDDRLGVRNEAKAFARAAAAISFDPPLAFGIFGNWGSGKSFFMRLVHNHVEDLKSGEAEEAATGKFHKDIVQIRFNAWHYVDQNLWASLVDHIFTEIELWTRPSTKEASTDPLLEKLVTARELTLEAGERLIELRQEQASAQQKLREAEKNLEEARTKAVADPAAYGRALLMAFEQHKKDAKKDLKEAAHTLGVDDLVDSAKSFEVAAAELSSETGKVRVLWQSRVKLLFSPWMLAALFGAVVVAPAIFTALANAIRGSQIPWLSALTGEISPIMLQVTTAVGGAAIILRTLAAKVGEALSIVDRFRRDVEAEAAKKVSNESADAQKAAGNVELLVAEAERAKVELVAVAKQLTEASRDFNAESGHSRLVKLIRERMGEQGYAKHLGLIAMIRKDFAELSSIVTGGQNSQDEVQQKQTAAYLARVDKLIADAGKTGFLKEDEIKALEATKRERSYTGRTFSRVVLYIDDLDRCPPDRVVQVLQAVHLMLTFPLFVIFVAVDARWVGRSLEQHYGKLLQDDEEGAADVQRSAASALDYLEKIFQVAYKVRALDAAGSSTFLDARAKPKASPTPPSLLQPRENSGFDTSKGGAEAQPPPIAPNQPTSDPDEPVPPKLRSAQVELIARAIEMSPEELAYISRIAGCAGDTPRRALRFLNSYRVIKAGLSEDDLMHLSDKRGHRALMTQLALATSVPAAAKRFNTILEGTTAFGDLKGMLSDKAKRDSQSGSATVVTALRVLLTEASPKNASEQVKIPDSSIRNVIASLKHYGAVATRYSFVR